ncbi:MAG: elongation factor G, partial [Rhodospirillales bacterium]
HMSTEPNIASTEYLGEKWTFIDCPGSIELIQDTYNALMAADTAVVVCEADVDKALTVAPLLKFLNVHGIPHMIFINKLDTQLGSVKDTLTALQAYSDHPLVMREIPIREGDQITGFVDLVSERAYRWNPDNPSEIIQTPDSVAEREEEARTEMLEYLADFDDSLLESLLEDTIPSSDEIYGHMTRELQDGYIVPVFFGAGEHNNGVRRLLKALRHETPEPSRTFERLGIEAGGAKCVARVFKTLHAAHTGKMSLARVWTGEVADGMILNGSKVSGLGRMMGQKQEKISKAAVGEVVALGRMDEVVTGDLLSDDSNASGGEWPEPLPPQFSLAIHAENRSDEVKLPGALTKMTEEDPSLSFEHSADTNELLLWGQGEMHLLIAVDRLKNRYSLGVASARPQVPYKETIRKPTTQHSRHKKQSGGHGQFGDVHIDIKPLPRGSGFTFAQTISGGVVPRQYFSAIENGVKEYMSRGPLGFQVVDISVTLTDGQHHAVDSSDMAFRAAAQLAMRQGMPNCAPVLLEPIFKVDITLPNEFTSKIQRLVSGRRGQILGFDANPGWKGWDQVSVQLPQSEMHDLIIELRSMTLGVGAFKWRLDHLQELTGREAEQVVSARAEALAN